MLLLAFLMKLNLIKLFLLLLQLISLNIEEKIFPATLTFPVCRNTFDIIKFCSVVYVYHEAGDSYFLFCKEAHVYRMELSPFD